jgi:predicted transcriptional regulator
MTEVRPPTEAETAILAVLWARGPSTVREVHDVLEPDRHVGYTTVLKLLQIMTDKGLALRDASKRTHVYRAAMPRAQMQGRMLGELAARAFGGSTSALVMRALSSRRTSPEELAEIRRLLDDLQSEDKP